MGAFCIWIATKLLCSSQNVVPTKLYRPSKLLYSTYNNAQMSYNDSHKYQFLPKLGSLPKE
ncbi:hypothetical protein [Escherichia phage UPEC06]|nr:hypothetical protein [Escherichia phage UPEC06]